MLHHPLLRSNPHDPSHLASVLRALRGCGAPRVRHFSGARGRPRRLPFPRSERPACQGRGGGRRATRERKSGGRGQGAACERRGGGRGKGPSCERRGRGRGEGPACEGRGGRRRATGQGASRGRGESSACERGGGG